LILTRDLYESEDEYVLNLTMNLLEAFSQKVEVPTLIIKIAVNYLGILVS